MFRMYYECPECYTTWEDEWTHTCDDTCPECDIAVEPYEVEDIEEA